MRKIILEKWYTEDCVVRYEMAASNVAYVYVNNKSNFPPQQLVDGDDVEANMDGFYRETFNRSPLQWLRKVTTYRQDNPSRQDIPFGVEITCNEIPAKVESYVVEYAGRKCIHEGMVIDRLDLEKALYEEWRSIYLPNNQI